jgi:hypothetical protein
MDLLTMKIGEAAAKLLVKHGKEGVKKLLTEPDWGGSSQILNGETPER